jgi:cellulose biosynthesis protein BcsQ
VLGPAAVVRTNSAGDADGGELSVLGMVFLKTGGNATIRVMMEKLARELAEDRGVPVLRNKIPTEARFNEAEAYGMPVGERDRSARSAIAYRELAVEIQAMLASETVAA